MLVQIDSNELARLRTEATEAKRSAKMSDILVIKCNVFMRDKQMDDLYDHIKSQMEDGLVLLPPYCEVQVVPDGVELKIEDANGKVVKEVKNVNR